MNAAAVWLMDIQVQSQLRYAVSCVAGTVQYQYIFLVSMNTIRIHHSMKRIATEQRSTY